MAATEESASKAARGAGAPRARVVFVPVGLLVVWLLAAALIVVTAGRPLLDQSSLVGIPISRYPSFDDEIVPRLLAGALYAIGPRSPAAANTLVRLVAAAAYLGAAALLARSLLGTSGAQVALLAVLLASGYPFMWLSSELVSGALLCVAISLVVTGRPAWLIGVSLGVLALTKSEMIAASVAIGAVHLRRRPALAPPLIAGFAVTMALFAAPGLALHGTDFFRNRTWSAFGQHYAAITSRLHLTPDRDPWNDWARYVQASFPGDSSVLQVVLHDRVTYSYYVALSAMTGLWNAWHAFGLLLPAIAARIALRSAPRPADAWLGVAMVILVPEVLIAYPQVRYLAKLAPLVVMVPLAEIERRRDRWGIAMAAAMATYVALAAIDRLHATGPGGWFPD